MKLFGAPYCTQTLIVLIMLIINIVMTIYKQNPISYTGLGVSLASVLLVQLLCARGWFYTSWGIAILPLIPVIVFTVMTINNWI